MADTPPTKSESGPAQIVKAAGTMPSGEKDKTASPDAEMTDVSTAEGTTLAPTADGDPEPAALPHPRCSPETEQEIRMILSKARKIAVKGEDEATSEASIKDWAQLATNLVQLMNASAMGTDLIVRAIGYMRESHLLATRALKQAYKDRTADRLQRKTGEKQQVSGDATTKSEKPLAEVKNKGSDGTSTNPKASASSSKARSDDKQENVAPGTEAQSKASAPTQTDAKKKNKRYSHRRGKGKAQNAGGGHKPQKSGTDGTTQATAADGANGSKDVAAVK